MSITRNFNLYLNAGHSIPLVINVSQYDQGEIWNFTLYNSDGTQYTPTDGSIVGMKSDGNLIANAGTVSDGIVTITETEQMTAAAGKCLYELQIDGNTHGTMNFVVMVEADPTEGGTVSDSDLSLLQEALDATSSLPTGGTVGQVLTKTATGSAWSDAGNPTDAQVATATADWLSENITVTQGVTIDTSLAVSGAAADSKTVGDELTILNSAFNNRFDTLPCTVKTGTNLLDQDSMVAGKYLNTSGDVFEPETSTVLTSAFYIPVTAGKTLHSSRLYNTGNLGAANITRCCFYDVNKQFLSKVDSSNTITVPNNAVFMRVCVATVYVTSYGFQIEYDAITHWNPYTHLVVVNADNLKNKLYGKRLLICGDSITYGYNADERNAYAPTLGTYVNVLSSDNANWRENTVLKKTFGYYIGERNAMTVAINAVSGSTMAENANSAQDGYAPAPFSRTNATAGQNRYVDAITNGADYCLLWFGANDSTYYADGKMVIGTSADTNNKSEWGAWNLVLNYYRTNYPNTKIGIIIPWCTELAIRDCIRDVGKYWGIPVLDWMGDTQVPLMTAYGRDGQTVNADLLTTIENTWYHGSVSNDKMHPNDVGYQQISTVIEQFLMTL